MYPKMVFLLETQREKLICVPSIFKRVLDRFTYSHCHTISRSCSDQSQTHSRKPPIYRLCPHFSQKVSKRKEISRPFRPFWSDLRSSSQDIEGVAHGPASEHCAHAAKPRRITPGDHGIVDDVKQGVADAFENEVGGVPGVDPSNALLSKNLIAHFAIVRKRFFEFPIRTLHSIFQTKYGRVRN